MADPPVVVVMVTRNPGPWFDEVLSTLAAQMYPQLSVLIVDAASDEDPAPRVARVLPDAHVHRMDRNPGFGAAVNEAIATVRGAQHYVVCHDDVALEPDTIRRLVAAAHRSDAGIVGPKLVDWHDPRRVLQVGMDADKTGAVLPIAEHGELDQSQHDTVHEVFVVPGACTLIRAELFDRIGGYDAGIDFLGDDLDLCWRGHGAGARVVIATDARVRHLEALAARRPVDDRRRLLARHRLRTMLGTYRLVSLLRVIPQAIAFAAMEATYALLSGRVDHARDVAGAWPWNLRRLGQLRRKRRAARSARAVHDRTVRQLQLPGSARLSGFLRGQLGHADDRPSSWTSAGPAPAARARSGSPPRAMVAVTLLAAVVAFGSRELLAGPIPAFGELPRFPSRPGPLLEEWAGGWRTAGLGSDAPAPTAFGVLGLLGWVAGGAMGLLRSTLVLAMLPLGGLGAWRMARPIGSLASSVAALAVYLAVAVPYNALAAGSWSGLVLYAAAPWFLLSLARASRLEPFVAVPRGVGDRPPGRRRVDRSDVGGVVRLGMVVALAAAIVPFAVVVLVVMAVGLALGSASCGRARGIGRILVSAILAGVVAVVLHLPWSFELLRPSGDWATFARGRTTTGDGIDLAQLLRFQTGPFGATPLAWAPLALGALGLVAGRAWRHEWAVRAWAVALTTWGLVWAGQQDRLPVDLPPAEVLLAPAAAGLALAGALGVAALDVDLAGARTARRTVLTGAAAVALVLAVLPLGTGLVDGRWKVPRRDFGQSLDPVIEPTAGAPYRTLWVGDAGILPLAGRPLEDGVAYGITWHGTPEVTDRWPTADRSDEPVARATAIAARGGTARLGRLLAPMGIRYIVVPSSPAPDTRRGDRRPAPTGLLDALGEQLDLEAVPVAGDVDIYRNRAWFPTGSVLPVAGGPRQRLEDAAREDLSRAEPALDRHPGPAEASGTVREAGDLLVGSSYSDGWELTVDGRGVPHRRLYGWANGFTVEPASSASPARAELVHRPSFRRRLPLAGQGLLWVAALVVAIRLRPRRDRVEPGR